MSSSSKSTKSSKSCQNSEVSDCVVCMTAPVSTTLPCFHSVLCDTCADSLLSTSVAYCPVCRLMFVDHLPLSYGCNKSKFEEASKLYANGMELLYEKKMLNEAFESFHKSAKLGFPFSKLVVGSLYQIGCGTSKNKKKATTWLLHAAESNLHVATMQLAESYGNGKSGVKDSKKMVELYKIAAKSNRPLAQFNLAKCYLSGEGTKVDVGEAFKLLIKASESKRYAEPMNLLASLYLAGIGTSSNPEKAAELFEAGAALNDHKSQHEASRCYWNGIGVEKDENKSMEYLLAAALAGYAPAENDIGYRHLNGNGVSIEPTVGIQFLTKSKLQGYIGAWYTLGEYYCNGIECEKLVSKKYFQEAEERILKKKSLKRDYAECLENGEGCPKNEEKAIELYKETCDKLSSKIALYRLDPTCDEVSDFKNCKVDLFKCIEDSMTASAGKQVRAEA